MIRFYNSNRNSRSTSLRIVFMSFCSLLLNFVHRRPCTNILAHTHTHHTHTRSLSISVFCASAVLGLLFRKGRRVVKVSLKKRQL